MTHEQQLMIAGMDMLLRKFSRQTDDTIVTVEDIINAANEVYDKILEEPNANKWILPREAKTIIK